MTFYRCEKCGREYEEQIPGFKYSRCPFCGVDGSFINPSKGETLPSEKEVLEYVAKKGRVTNDQMYAEKFGDVERGINTVSKLHRLFEKGVLKRGIIFHGSSYTEICWEVK